MKPTSEAPRIKYKTLSKNAENDTQQITPTNEAAQLIQIMDFLAIMTKFYQLRAKGAAIPPKQPQQAQHYMILLILHLCLISTNQICYYSYLV